MSYSAWRTSLRGSLRKRRFPSEQMGTESSLDAFPFILDPADSNPGVGQPNRRFILEIQTDSHHSIAIIELGNRASHKPITSQVSRCKHLIAKPSRRVSLQASKPSDAPFRVFLCASETSMRELSKTAISADENSATSVSFGPAHRPIIIE
ncbi:hypothetical protein H4Q26_011541 [Puccinia striiformis f. sp. tritici PST-130]|nr:hypothetical protein H4Q26_011541 [Puccinia striiformis f. sp. tritici PST-130]